MATLLLIIIYISFISLGLPDTLLGSSWPVMHLELGVPISFAGVESMIVSCGTIISSFFSSKIIAKLGTGKVMVFSVFLTAVALLGTAFTPNFLVLCILGIPLGIGAGAVDSALNNFVALHYKARHMSWLHCFWGVGASAGPLILSFYIGKANGWKWGYGTIGVLQFVLVAVLFASLPLWKKMTKQETVKGTEHCDRSEEATGLQESQNVKQPEIVNLTIKEVLKLKHVKPTMLTFFAYCASEMTVGLWGSSYFVSERGLSPALAAKWIAMYYVGITLGRFISGFLTIKINNKNMVRLGECISLIGVIFIILPLPNLFILFGLILIGLGFAPIYPSLLHDTPKRFGAEHSQQIMGMQMAIAYTGNTLVPPLFGLLAQNFGLGLYPAFLMVILAMLILPGEYINAKTRT